MDDRSPQARLARAAPLLPLLIGGLGLLAERSGAVSAPVAIVATAVASAIALWLVVTAAAEAQSTVEDERRRLLARLDQLADRDSLTGAYNARRLDEEVRRQLAFAQRYNTRIAVLAIELEGFDWIVEEYGHATTDELLIASAEVLVDELRATDLVTRRVPHGFVVLIPQTDEHAARIVAGKLIRRLRAIERARPGGASIKLRASVGVALSDPKGLDGADRLLARADEALGVAQAAGGDRLALPGEAVARGGE
ncbi:MAG TPA: GGDEF domain-containing protein [Solirubrobacterales bacterium]|nr:GGDEF domain-containing protein [Solirubrobacterales bacterium]